jgi:hypothetical protein
MVYFLPNEFMAPANQVVQEEMSPDVNEDEQLGGLMAQLVLAKQATFDKPARNRHMRPLYLRKKRKYASFIFLVMLPPLLPFQLFKDHRDSNLEASRVAMTCSLHQAVPSSLQVTVPVGNI